MCQYLALGSVSKLQRKKIHLKLVNHILSQFYQFFLTGEFNFDNLGQSELLTSKGL